jgi:hypothetical protein
MEEIKIDDKVYHVAVDKNYGNIGTFLIYRANVEEIRERPGGFYYSTKRCHESAGYRAEEFPSTRTYRTLEDAKTSIIIALTDTIKKVVALQPAKEKKNGS